MPSSPCHSLTIGAASLSTSYEAKSGDGPLRAGALPAPSSAPVHLREHPKPLHRSSGDCLLHHGRPTLTMHRDLPAELPLMPKLGMEYYQVFPECWTGARMIQVRRWCGGDAMGHESGVRMGDYSGANSLFAHTTTSTAMVSTSPSGDQDEGQRPRLLLWDGDFTDWYIEKVAPNAASTGSSCTAWTS